MAVVVRNPDLWPSRTGSTRFKVDGPWSWVVAAGAFWVTFFIMGLFRCYGILFVEVLHLYGVSRQMAAWPFSLCGTVLNLSGVLPGILSRTFSVRQIVMFGGIIGSLGVSACFFASGIDWITACFGVLYGLGIGVIIPSQPVLLNKCFKKYRATACGLCFAGGALSSMLFPPLAEKLLEEYGLRGTFLVFGGLMLNTTVGAAVLWDFGSIEKSQTFISDNDKNKNQTILQVTQQESENLLQTSKPAKVTGKNSYKFLKEKSSMFKSLTEILSDSLFYFTALSSASGWMACFTFSMVVVDFGLDQHLPKDRAVLLITIFSATEFVGRLCSGWLSDSGLVKRKNVILVSATLSGIVLIIFPFLKHPIALYFMTAIYGVLVGSQIILYYVLLADYVRIENLALGVSLAFSFGGTLSLTRPMLVGIIRDVTGSYNELFYLLGLMSILGGVVWLLEPTVLMYRARKASRQTGRF